MDVNIITIHYHPFTFLKNSLENNYRIFKKENIKFKHYLVDNKYPLEEQQHQKVKELCDHYNITYLNGEKNLGLVAGKKFFHETIKPKDIIFHLESDVYLLSENILTDIYLLNKKNDVENVIYLNNKNLNDYKKQIYKINNINVFELDIKNLNHTWIQCCFYNTNYQKKIQKIIDSDNRNNYDFPGENNDKFKKENIPFLVANDLYEDMEKYRFQNYFEYEYYKAIVYYWSKFEKEYQHLTFEEFISNYDYYLNMEDKFIACYSNFRLRGRDFVINPNFYFEKTKIKFRKLNTDYIIGKVKNNKKAQSLMRSIKIKE